MMPRRKIFILLLIYIHIHIYIHIFITIVIYIRLVIFQPMVRYVCGESGAISIGQVRRRGMRRS